MGILSLIFGIIAIGIAIFFTLGALLYVFIPYGLLVSLGITIITGVLGVFLIQKYDADKKEKDPEKDSDNDDEFTKDKGTYKKV